MQPAKRDLECGDQPRREQRSIVHSALQVVFIAGVQAKRIVTAGNLVIERTRCEGYSTFVSARQEGGLLRSSTLKRNVLFKAKSGLPQHNFISVPQGDAFARARWNGNNGAISEH